MLTFLQVWGLKRTPIHPTSIFLCVYLRECFCVLPHYQLYVLYRLCLSTLKICLVLPAIFITPLAVVKSRR